MKRLTTLFAAMVCSATLFAGPVGYEEATATARAYLASRGVTLLSTETPYKAPSKGRTVDNPPYYVVNAGNDKGYVIVSGDDRTPAVLGYVDKGSFDEENLPDNMRAFLAQLSAEIQSLDESGDSEESSIRKRAVRVKYTRHSISPLVKSRWNQGGPYNGSCPDFVRSDGSHGRAVTGCVATAFAQIINFYKYPDETVEDIPAHVLNYNVNQPTYERIVCPLVPKGTKIDWENMCDTYNGSETDAQRKAVADLMLYCGQSVRMSYGASSGAVTQDCHGAILKYFGFDDSAKWVARSDYDVEAWIELLYNELAAGYPILFSAISTGGGHAFVIDGFDGENLFHVNWGWGGSSDGWFSITSLNPGDNSGIGASTTADGYSMWQGAMIGVRLPDNRPVETSTKLDVNNINIRSTIVTVTFQNNSGYTNNFLSAMVYMDGESRAYVPVGMTANVSNLENGGTKDVTFNLTNKLTKGTYKLYPASHLPSNKTWRPAFNNPDRNYVLAEVDENGRMTLEHIQRRIEFVTDTIIFPGTCLVNQSQQVSITFRNLAEEFFNQMSLFAVRPGSDEKVFQNSRSQVSIPKDSKTTVIFNFRPDTVGTYHIYVCDNSGKVEYGHATVDIKTSSTTGYSLKVTSIKMKNSLADVIYGNRFQGVVKIRNQQNVPFDGKVRIQIWSEGSGGTYWSSSSTTVPMYIAPLGTGDANFNFQNLAYNHNYQIVVYYVGQDGYLDNGQMWNSAHVYHATPGIIYWKEDGELAAIASKPITSAPQDACGLYMNGTDMTYMTPNNKNPNTIYTFAKNDNLPMFRGVKTHLNVVQGGQADTIKIASGYPYYVSVAFRAKHATFSYTFPDNTDGTFWQPLSVPFTPQSMKIDSVEYALNAKDNHFWIYEFTRVYDDVTPDFQPAGQILSELPYLIAGDASMAGKTITFSADNVDFHRLDDVKNIVTSDYFTFTCSPVKENVKGAYHLNAAGTAYEYVAQSKNVPPLTGWFTTSLDADRLPASIQLPPVPLTSAVAQVKSGLAGERYPVFNTAGQRVGQAEEANGILSLPQLKPGIYVVNGRKMLIR